MTSNQELPEYTPYAAAQPLPDAVAALARLIGRETVRAYGIGDYPLPGRAFEAIANAPYQQTDERVRQLAIRAGTWLDHPQFPGEFGHGYRDGAQADTDPAQTPPEVDTLSGVIGDVAPNGPRHAVPRITNATTITDVLAATLARTYGRVVADEADLAAARETQAHIVVILEHLSTDPRVCQAASTTAAVLNAVRVLDHSSILHQTMTGELSTG